MDTTTTDLRIALEYAVHALLDANSDDETDVHNVVEYAIDNYEPDE